MNNGFFGWKGTGSPAWVTAALAADVTMTTANTFYDGPSVTLDPGIWFLMGHVTTSQGTAAVHMTAKLWDGVTAVDSGQQPITSAAFSAEVALNAIVTLTTQTTYKISATHNNTGGGVLRAATPQNGSGNHASTLIAVRLGGGI